MIKIDEVFKVRLSLEKMRNNISVMFLFFFVKLSCFLVIFFQVSCASNGAYSVRYYIQKPSKIILKVNGLSDLKKEQWRSAFMKLGYTVLLVDEIKSKTLVKNKADGADIYSNIIINKGYQFLYDLQFTEGIPKSTVDDFSLRVVSLEDSKVICVYENNFKWSALNINEVAKNVEEQFLEPIVYQLK